MSEGAEEGHGRAAFWGRLIGIALFLAIWLMPTPAGMSVPAQRLAAVTALMAVFWVTQAYAIVATSLFPLALYPFLGILPAKEVCQAYISDSSFLYLGGFLIALGMERWHLHRRIALHIICRTGSSPRQIVLGFMLATFVLSMWVSNTATTLMMLPIAIALLTSLEDSLDHGPKLALQQDPAFRHLGQAVMLGIAYSATIGGVATPVGTPTNAAFLTIFANQFPDAPRISAGQWMIAWVPFGVVFLGVAWLVLTWGLKRPPGFERFDRSFFRSRLTALGRASRPEMAMLAAFLAIAGLWIFRTDFSIGDTPLIPGWNRLVIAWLRSSGVTGENQALGEYVNDAAVAMTVALVLFLIPVRDPASGRRVKLMDWRTARSVPWDILFLFGGGFAIANAFQKTGLSIWAGQHLEVLGRDQPAIVVVAAVTLMMVFLTEFTTNVATVAATMPLLASLAVALEVDPRLLMVPATIAASCGFMMPVGTPPNAIVFGTGRVRVECMAGYGAVLNVVGMILVVAATYLVMAPTWNVRTDHNPDWAKPKAAQAIDSAAPARSSTTSESAK